MWTKIIEFLIDKDNHRFLLLAAVGVLCILFFRQIDRTQMFRAEVDRQLNNIEALSDSVRYYENRAGELTAQRLAYQTTIENLEELNENLYEEVQKEQDNVEQLTQINAELRRDSVEADSTEIIRRGPDSWTFNWDFSESEDGWNRSLTGFTNFQIDQYGLPHDPRSVLIEDALTLRITTGITERNGQKQIFVRSNYPYINFVEIQGVILDEPITSSSPSRLGIGPTIGAGYTLEGFQPYVGIGINYNLIGL